jgi:CheY-like chemotaxis protein
MLPRVIGAHVELVTELADELDSVRADKGQIEQVIMNLVINARDAMPGGGTLTIATAEVELDEADAAELAMPAGRYVRLELSDTGCGIDAETQRHLFEPFFTTKEVGKGTGLGLATVYGIVTQSDGYVTVNSKVGQGSTFSIHLAAARAPADRPEQTVPREPSSGTETILVVEDELLVRDLARIALEGSGYRILDAESGLEALAVAEGHDGPIALLLTDVVMPLMGGFDLAARLAQSRPSTAVLYMSGYPAGCLGDGPGIPAGSNFIEKPFELAQLPAKVREVLDGVRAPLGERGDLAAHAA